MIEKYSLTKEEVKSFLQKIEKRIKTAKLLPEQKHESRL